MNILRNRRKGRWLLGLGLPITLLVQGCAVVGSAPAPPYAPEELAPGWTETGIASWYGHPFHGRTTASGEVYDMNDPTCAHKRLPFGTRLRVENLDNGKTVQVRINARGPFIRDRNIGSAIVLSNSLVRGAFTALRWISPQASPNKAFSNVRDAARWCIEGIESNGQQVPASAYVLAGMSETG